MKWVIEKNGGLHFAISTMFDPLKIVVTSADIPPKIFERKTHRPLGAQPRYGESTIKQYPKGTTTPPCTYQKQQSIGSGGYMPNTRFVILRHFPCC